MPKVARTPHGRPWGAARPHVKPTQQVGTPVVLSEDTHSMLTSPSFPEHMSGDEDSSRDEEYTTPLTLSTACDPISADMPHSTVGAGEDDSQSTINQQPCLVQSVPPDQATDSVSTEKGIEQDSEPDSDSEPSDNEQDTKSPAPPVPRRSARSTKGIPSVHYGQVHIHSTIISEVAKPTRYKQTLYIPCYQVANGDEQC